VRIKGNEHTFAIYIFSQLFDAMNQLLMPAMYAIKCPNRDYRISKAGQCLRVFMNLHHNLPSEFLSNIFAVKSLLWDKNNSELYAFMSSIFGNCHCRNPSAFA
jgi:hypothetical protein